MAEIVLSHAELAAARAGEGWEKRCTLDARQDAYDRCMAAQRQLAAALLGAGLDAMVIIGDDHTSSGSATGSRLRS